MNSKPCIACEVTKPLTDFYKHPRMADGHLNRCKQCQRANVAEARSRNREHYAQYERRRFKTAARKAKVLTYARRHRERHPDRYAARTLLNVAVKSGKVKREPCCYCGNPKSQAHHHDYSKPLDVRWVCFRCHREREHGQTVLSD